MNCPVCSATTTADGELSVCGRCGHVYQTNLVSSTRYDQEYCDVYRRCPCAAMSKLRLRLLRRLAARGSVLDVGCGLGHFVTAANRAGYAAYGNDLFDPPGVPMQPLRSGTWDVVTFFDSLEHFADLGDVRDLLGRTRRVLISLPHRPAWFPRQRDWKHYKPGEHLHYFSLESLCELMRPKVLLWANFAEDTIRRGRDNILTCAFANSVKAIAC